MSNRLLITKRLTSFHTVHLRSDVTLVILGEKGVGKTTFIEHCFVSSLTIKNCFELPVATG